MTSPEFFRSMVLPALATVKLSAIVEAYGLAKGTASNWRAGKADPAPVALAGSVLGRRRGAAMTARVAEW